MTGTTRWANLIADAEVSCSVPRIGEWQEGADGNLVRIRALPDGMTMQEAERIVSQPGWKTTTQPSKPGRVRSPLEGEW
jgi:hypothetical protein